MRFGGGVAIWCRECMLRYVEQRALRDVRRSSHRLCPMQTASFGEDEDYNQADAAGFINLFGLSIKERAKLSKSWPKIED